ncbi:MAG: hypothetical protein M0R17_06105 [Candidatus Omnitrophica bacterium]|jgi:hypothetical protein|nr:hypothetical protein [Candidatus Omnitrophota bacterium]
MDEQKGIRQEVEDLKKEVYAKKSKKLRFPARGKVNSSKLKKGWIAILKVGDNRVITAEKVPIEDSCYITSDGTYHYFDGHEVLFWNGKTKMPVLIQPVIKLNPLDLVTGKNETRGQKTILALMRKNVIKVKDKSGGMKGIAIIAGVILVGYVLGKYVFKLF